MSDEAAIRAVVQQYFDALYDGDVAAFRQAFHPEAQLFSAENAVTAALGLDAWLERVANRPAPAATNDARVDEVVSLAQPSATTAHVRVRDALGAHRFIDELLLIKYPQGWKIVCKAWAYDSQG
ncbi:nuclear transport factor 2 family protein [Roseomonas sp. USHLN139]|uniref:nuclear transport factor 2 family protein n=1 Tax=Roseomonas sp. USHLN139 TaxID=3081298 RepID=UPI003B0144C8